MTAPGPADETLIGRLFYHAKVRPEHTAIACPVRTISYHQLASLVVAQANELRHRGVTAGATLGICCHDDVEHLILCLAGIYCGATTCTIPSHESPAARDALMQRCGASHLIEKSDVLNTQAEVELPWEAEASQALVLFSTSGTTGEPKLVMHRDSDLVAQAHRHVSSEQERFACLASVEHNFAKRHRLYCVAMGATNVFPGALDDTLVERCSRLQVNVLHVSAFQAQELLALHGWESLTGLRLKLGGSHVAPALRQQLREQITPRLQAGYGTTETGAIAFTDPDDMAAGDSVGRPLPGIEIHAVDEQGQTLPNGQRGELAVRCKGMFRGYLNRPELTDERLQDDWFHTGDIGFIDSDGRIHISGRSDDMFVFNSMNIFPQDIESVIRDCDGVQDAVVLPRPSAVHGSIPVALVVLKGSPKKILPLLQKQVKKQVGIRAPRQYMVVDAIPTNASGKIARRDAMAIPQKVEQLRKDLIGLIDAKVKQRVKPALLKAFVNGKTDIALRRFEMDSLERLELLLTLETGYDIVVPPAKFNGFRYLGDLVSYVLSPDEEKSDAATTEVHPVDSIKIETPTNDAPPPHVVTFFQRVLRVSRAIVQLNKALNTLENRLVPQDLYFLCAWYEAGRLLPDDTPKDRQAIVCRWLQNMTSLLVKSGKLEAEPYALTRVAPTARLFAGPGPATNKAILICFPPSGGRNMMMPNTVFLQYLRASQVDVLMLSETLNQKYRKGIPFVGRNPRQIADYLAQQDWIGAYARIVTMGCSAGAPLALTAAGRLNATVGVSVCGRFYRRRHVAANVDRLLSIYRAKRRASNLRMIYAYGVDDVRDRYFAERMAPITASERWPVSFGEEAVGHEILRQLLDRGELKMFLEKTLFGGRNLAEDAESEPLRLH
ncbi:acyl-coenzyme A synthetase/AMP-(fatty) acid ligase/acyl carrier protein [Litorivivens lipolytica]|uniref:Acyl-coenzyme A synthetase/AMP-(Fatty) acid ligase/acyl carrier protein n=1 Tax=Litorivivens lipolytica TaxID=1524264 RepID=A0A7W4W6D3_9GAMM|nr:AMP-binding protein [Litorivivens lipolytica]MBB3047714.1 acyl-coenzyme A synthetase/AMP-(fatty) acid ligase/acyl carrier protein [Litorivivens lipolytica]